MMMDNPRDTVSTMGGHSAPKWIRFPDIQLMLRHLLEHAGKVCMSMQCQVGLGVGRTQHSAPVEDGAVGRKGISVERTFAAISSAADLETKVLSIPIGKPIGTATYWGY